MKKIALVALCIASFNAQAFLDFNNYQSGYQHPDDNDWPIWTPMYWMEEVFDRGDRRDRRYQNYPYPYGGTPYNINAQRFNMNQMPTPDEAYYLETQAPAQQAASFNTPAAMSFSQTQEAQGSDTQSPITLPAYRSYQGGF